MIIKMFKLNILRDSDHSLVIRFLASYLVILLIPVFIGTLVYKEAIKIVESDVEASNLSMLNQCRDIIDQQFTSIDIMKNQIGLSPQLNLSLKNSDIKQLDFYYEMRKLMDQLRPYSLSVNIVDNFFIYMKNPNYIISPIMAYDADFFFQYVFKYEPMNHKQWLTELNRYHSGTVFPTATATLESRNISVIPYIHSLPTTYLRKVEGAIVFLLKAETIQKLLNRINLLQGGWVLILDQNNQIITGLTDKKLPQNAPVFNTKKTEGYEHSYFWGERMVVSYTTSVYNGWKYVSILPSRLVMGKVIYIKRIVSGFIVLSLLIGALIAYFLTARNTKPLRKILNLIKENLKQDPKKEGDAFQFLHGSISKLIDDNQELQETIENYMPIIRTAFFDRLLKGEFNKTDQIEAISSYLGLEIKGNGFLVLLLRIFGQDDIFNREIIEESNITKMLLSETINKHLECQGYIHDIDQNNIAILLLFDDCQIEQCYRKAENIIKKIEKDILGTYKLKVCFGGGNIYRSLLDIWQSYQEAGRVLQYKTADIDSKIIWCHSLPQEGTEYYYPIDFEQRLMNYVKAGELKQVETILEIIYRENTEKRKLTPEMLKELIHELKGTIVKLCTQLTVNKKSVETVLNKIDYSETFEGNYRNLKGIFQNISKKVIGNRKFRNVQLKEKIIQYINDYYHQPDLSLHKIASNFGLSEGYLSHFFKDQVGENFLSYLENERIKHACELLKNEKLPISDIAMKVGYNSAQSFRRAFKRVKGVNPTTLRNTQM